MQHVLRLESTSFISISFFVVPQQPNHQLQTRQQYTKNNTQTATDNENTRWEKSGTQFIELTFIFSYSALRGVRSLPETDSGLLLPHSSLIIFREVIQ